MAFTVSTVKVPTVPLSARVRRVFGDPSASLTVSVPLTPVVASVIFGVPFERVNGAAPDRVSVPDAFMVVTPAMDPALVIPPVLLLIPPVIDAPPELTVKSPLILCAVVKLLFCPL